MKSENNLFTYIIPILVVLTVGYFIFFFKPSNQSSATSEISDSCARMDSTIEMEYEDLGCLELKELEDENEELKSKIERLENEKSELEEEKSELESENQAMIDFMWDEFEYEWE